MFFRLPRWPAFSFQAPQIGMVSLIDLPPEPQAPARSDRHIRHSVVSAVRNGRCTGAIIPPHQTIMARSEPVTLCFCPSLVDGMMRSTPLPQVVLSRTNLPEE
jgi:hypothetical protein